MRPLRRLKQPLLTALCFALSVALRPWSRAAPLPEAVASVLFIRPCCLGDVLLTTATVRAVAQAWPQARLDYLVSHAASAGLVTNPHLARLIPAPTSIAAFVSLAWRCRRSRYDVGIVLDRSPIWSLFAFLAGARVRAGLDSRWRGFGLTHRVVPQPHAHEASLAASVARSVGVAVTDLREEYVPSSNGRDTALSRLHDLPGGRRVVIHPGGGVNPGMTLLAKRWPPQRFAALIERLSGAGATVILVGAASDCDVVQTALDKVTFGRVSLNLAGELDLDAHAALVAACDLYIGHDSGPTHLAAATGTPTIAIFGPTDPGMYAPPGDHVRIVWRGARFDDTIDLRSQAVDATAILAISVEDVWQAAVSLLPALAAPPSGLTP